MSIEIGIEIMRYKDAGKGFRAGGTKSRLPIKMWRMKTLMRKRPEKGSEEGRRSKSKGRSRKEETERQMRTGKKQGTK